MLARQDTGATRLYVLGLGAHAIAIAVLFASILGTRPEAESPETPPTPAPTPALEKTAAIELLPARLPSEESAAGPRTALPERVRSATAELAQVLYEPAAGDDDWSRTIAVQVETLERADEPLLEAILADASRPVEEHIAASELLDALRIRR